MWVWEYVCIAVSTLIMYTEGKKENRPVVLID